MKRPLLTALGLLLLGPALRAEELLPPTDQPPVLPPTALLPIPDAASQRPHRIRLFGFQPGFLSSPPGLDQDDPPTDSPPPPEPDGPDWVGVALGNDNPFFDIRRPGDPGGVGYLKVHTQVQVFDSPSTSCTVNLQAVTPAGRDQDGLADGPTVFTPALGLYQELDSDGTALQGFIGRHTPFQTRGLGGRAMHYGMALQKPLWEAPERPEVCYVFVGALGQVQRSGPAAGAPSLDVLPGVHWQLSPNNWCAGSLVLPVNPSATGRGDAGAWQPGWQLTLSWQF